MRILAMVNPVSGGGRALRSARELTELLRAGGNEVELYLTRGSGDARSRASDLQPGLEALVAVGGDGTINEVLNGLRDPNRVPLALVPTGTANVLARDLGLPPSPQEAARIIEDGSVRRLDMGVVGQRRFLSMVSSGFDALVTRDLLEHRTGTQGFLAYGRPILRTMRGYRPPELTVRIDDGEPETGQFVVACNTRNYGGLFTLADRASCDSGHLDVCIVKRAGILHIVKMAFAGLTGGLSGRRGTVYRTGTRVEISASEPYPVQVDGDYLGTTPITVEIVPAHVPVIVPRGSC